VKNSLSRKAGRERLSVAATWGTTRRRRSGRKARKRPLKIRSCMTRGLPEVDTTPRGAMRFPEPGAKLLKAFAVHHAAIGFQSSSNCSDVR